MVYLKNPGFKNKQGETVGMDIHIRTKITSWWSAIDGAAMRIGEDVLEMRGGSEDTWFWINGKANAEKLAIGKRVNTKIAG